MKSLFELIANRPWILIIAAFFLLITVWVVFLNLALRNQPEHLPLSGAGEAISLVVHSGSSNGSG